jgi:hypothetical protein
VCTQFGKSMGHLTTTLQDNQLKKLLELYSNASEHKIETLQDFVHWARLCHRLSSEDLDYVACSSIIHRV